MHARGSCTIGKFLYFSLFSTKHNTLFLPVCFSPSPLPSVIPLFFLLFSYRLTVEIPHSLVGRKAQSSSVGPLAENTSPVDLGYALCLRCTNYAEKDQDHHCLFDQAGSKKCSQCRAQKSKCLPVSALVLQRFFY
jgi:hypothetical protein